MDIRSVKYFLAVAEAGSITEAARALHLSQPPLSSAMTKLESELDVRLFERHARGIALTDAGRYLQSAGRRLVAEERRIASALRSMGLGLDGELRIGAEPLGLSHVVGAAVAHFLAEHPRITLELADANPRTLLENVADGYLDLAVIPVLPEEPLPTVNDVAFSTTVIARSTLTLVVPPSSRLADRGEVSLADLRDERWILPTRVPGARSLSRLLDDRFATAGGSPTSVVSVPTVETAATLVAAGVGVSVLSREMAERHSGVRAVAVEDGWPDLPLGVVRRLDGVITPVAGRFLDTLVAHGRGGVTASGQATGLDASGSMD
ncbi:LysR family transcriptional regulator [Rhodococcus sp. BP-149]|uniref:LysR family transcriptional regulator n=1 Tax=unclassified Rhodococcus (in: high G+C Gram-positive bacteria) TaxID=192944 RepID=UPI001C9A7FF7|nr:MULTISPECIES: LysR family transcriptional regulator [unclassified Rhodococcus (in: high G+C Gram-positive bacteria)]MBY6685608.1 LysR family transcriptional regulator [Rhodococcus sp. BP-288]MBY6694844.1 LysR family transcriptional regulator [Rhodococcus sp. BP-188]MBY6696690.1 LysR family transcriptional regulator [Rhodococcus sp. BP-285]MBY6703346.1 LysR family transcriptional regulator [Rhodococcus sp. BP-283]MBY6708669.1 LysR family transcriptional regulator [Rhodococcus sp. BP-241]